MAGLMVIKSVHSLKFCVSQGKISRNFKFLGHPEAYNILCIEFETKSLIRFWKNAIGG
jgi:hypothetical protein